MDASGAAVLSEPDGIFSFEEERTLLKAFLCGEDDSAFLLTDFMKSSGCGGRTPWCVYTVPHSSCMHGVGLRTANTQEDKEERRRGKRFLLHHLPRACLF